MPVKTILVSLPEPEERSPYAELVKHYQLTVHFRSFTHIEPIDAMEFREQKVNLPEHTAVILTSKVAVDHFFRIARETRFQVPESMKYFCISEAVALYIQNTFLTGSERFLQVTGTSQILPVYYKNTSVKNFFFPALMY